MSNSNITNNTVKSIKTGESNKTDKPAKFLERYKILWDISEASPIIRRYFAMNFFDGVLTALGIVLSAFVYFLQNQAPNNTLYNVDSTSYKPNPNIKYCDAFKLIHYETGEN